MATATAPASPVLLRSDEAGVATLTLNRPDQFNALSEALIAALRDALGEIAEDPAVHAVVIAASGRAFCAGHDLREMRERPEEAYYRDLFSRCGEMMQRVVSLPQPVIARVQGVATAAGCQLVASCDLAIASEEARFATSGVNLGLFCATPAVALSRAVRPKHAFELLFTGRFIDAAAAASLGLVNRVVPASALEAETTALAREIASKSPAALRYGKALFYRQLGLPLREAYEAAAETMAANMMEPDAVRGIDGFLARRR
jgi:enoyl-CoA hydratase/carnithine racemase